MHTQTRTDYNNGDATVHTGTAQGPNVGKLSLYGSNNLETTKCIHFDFLCTQRHMAVFYSNSAA